MTQPFIVQNQVPNEVELKDLLALHRKQILQNLNCHHIGTIQAFDPLTQLSTVKLAYKKTIFKPNIATGGYDPVLVDYPPIVDCITIILGGGKANLTFPIEEGDECLVLFNDRDLDNWYSGAPNGPVATPRLHAYADALVLVGIRSLANTLSDYDTSRAVLSYDGTARIVAADDRASLEYGDDAAFDLQADTATTALGSTQQKLTSAGKYSVTNTTGEMIALLYSLLNAIQSGVAGGYPLLLPASYTTDLTKFQSFKA